MSEPLGSPLAMGTFDESLEIARSNTTAEGGQVLVHRPIEMTHLAGADCPCRPVIMSGDSLHEADDVLAEVERCDG